MTATVAANTLLDDPTRPPASWLEEPKTDKQPSSETVWPEVRAVMQKQGRYRALVDGRWLAEGDQWQGHPITRIGPSEVVFVGPTGPVRRPVGSSNITKKVANDEV